MSEIDYSYRGGLVVNETEAISPAEMRQPLSDQGYREFRESVDQARIKVRAKVGGRERAVGITALTAESSEVVIYHPYWGAHFEGEVGLREAFALQQAVGEKQLILVDSPGSGRSDSLTPLAKKAAKTGSFDAYGEVYAEALQKFTNNFDSVTYAGASMGGRMAIAEGIHATAEARVVAIEPPGSQKMTTLELMKRFILTEANHASQYKRGGAEYDPESARAQVEQDSPFGFIHKLGSSAMRGALLDLFLREPQAMAHDRLAADIEAMLNNEKVSGATLVTASESALTDASKVPAREKLEHLIIANHTHSLFSGHPGALGRVLQLGLAA